MIFIVACHFLQYYDNELAWWFNVGVQVFFLVSGFLYGRKEDVVSIDFITRNFKKILIPYFCFLLPVMVLYALFAQEALTPSIAVKAVLCSGTVKGIGHLWFISYILFCYLITPYLHLIAKKLEKLKPMWFLAAVVGLLCLGQLVSLTYRLYFQFPRIACYIAGYFLFFYLKDCSQKRLAWTATVLFVLCLLFNGIRIYCKYVLHDTFPRFDLFEAYAHDLLAVALFFLYRLLFKNLRETRLFTLSDKYSYYIYLVHQLFILSPFSLMAVTRCTVVNWVMVLVAILLSAVALKVISDTVARCFFEKRRVLSRSK